jgi:hypothetical protein
MSPRWSNLEKSFDFKANTRYSDPICKIGKPLIFSIISYRFIFDLISRNQNILGEGIGGTYGSPYFRAHAGRPIAETR